MLKFCRNVSKKALLTILIGTVSVLSSVTGSFGEEQKEMVVLIRMMQPQEKWFRQKITQFEREYNVKITVATYDQLSDVERSLQLDRDSGQHSIGLVKTQKAMLSSLIRKNYVMPLEEAVRDDIQLEQDLQEYIDLAIEIGTIDGKHYYIPRKLESNVMLFLKSKVEDAVANWSKYRDAIHNMIKTENSYGLPDGFDVESDPNEWDWYDLAAVSYYWAHTPQEDGRIMPRMAHRGKLYGGTVMGIVDKIFQMGGTSADVLQADTDPVLDTLEWEAFFRKYELYNPGMWEQRWSGGGIWKAMQAGAVYLAFMHQIDAFFLHGVEGNEDMQGYLKNPADMAMAIQPKGVSLEIKDGKPARTGGHYSRISGWWWGIPKTSPDPALSYQLARWITSPAVHSEESATFGFMPVTKEVMNNLEKYYQEPWKREVFAMTQRQIATGVISLKTVSMWPGIEQKWLEIWDKICPQAMYSPDGPQGKIDRAYIRSQIQPEADTIKALAAK